MKNIASLIKLITAASVGTILEWYDFSLFAYLSPTLAQHFFPQQNALAALMLTYAVFATGYFVRPLGAILFGHLGDRRGRKATLVYSILLMSLPTCLIGLLPTYAEIGLAAPILLILLRLVQGIAAGGESTGAVLFVLESTSSKHRGLIGSSIWGMAGVGMLLGSLAAAIVSHYDSVMWAWRVPFILGILTGVLGYLLRRFTTESLLFTDVMRMHAQRKFPLWEGIIKYKREMLIIMGLYVLSAMITYLIFVFMPIYATREIGLPITTTTKISTWVFLGETLLIPLAGYLSDRMGRTTYLFWSTIGFVLLSYPLYKIIAIGHLSAFVFSEIVFLFLAASYQGVLSATVFELVPTAVRYSVIAVGYNVSYSLFGGTAPFIATFLVHLTGDKAAPGWYLMMGAMIALLAVSQLVTNKKRYTSYELEASAV